jgi:hypothetical protein
MTMSLPLAQDGVAYVEGARWDVATAKTDITQIALIPWGQAKSTQPRQADVLSLILWKQLV